MLGLSLLASSLRRAVEALSGSVGRREVEGEKRRLCQL